MPRIPGLKRFFRLADARRRLDLTSIDGEADRPYWIAISLVPGIGGVGFARMLERFGSARAAWASGF